MNNSTQGGAKPPLRRVLSLLALHLLLAALLVACGSGGGSETADLEARTAEIARGFVASGDIDSARTALQALGVANPLQWLIYQTDNAIGSNSDPELTRALVTLALEMDVREANIRNWAQANGLVQPSEATAAIGGATLAAAVLQPVPTLAPTEAVPGEAAAAPPVTAGDTNTSTSPETTAPGEAGAVEPAADVAAAPALAPTAAPALVSVAQLVNLRQGPGTQYNLAGSLSPGETATIAAKDATGEWWQIRTANGGLAWLFAALAATSGDTSAIALATDIPTPPPATPTSAPVAVVEQPTAAPAVAPESAPAPAPAADAAPTAAPEAPAAPAANPGDQPHFSLAAHRMWTKEENGSCAGMHLLRITVLDANGAPLNGVTLQGIYTGLQLTTGDQGKGDGRIEFDLYGSGEGFRVVRNNDGRDASSDNAEGFTTKSLDIPVPTLIQGGYCTNETDCQVFYNSFGCTGHHSWEATFRRNY